MLYNSGRLVTWKRNCALLGYYAASSGNFLTGFPDNLSVSSSGVKIFWGILDP